MARSYSASSGERVRSDAPVRSSDSAIASAIKGLDAISKPEAKGDRPWSAQENVRSFTGKDKDGNTITGGILVVPDKDEDYHKGSPNKKTLNIKFVYSGEGKGGGRMAMEKLIEMADKTGVTLSLSVAPFENPLKSNYPIPRHGKLMDFYRSLGFKTADSGGRKDYNPEFSTYMERKPKSPIDT